MAFPGVSVLSAHIGSPEGKPGRANQGNQGLGWITEPTAEQNLRQEQRRKPSLVQTRPRPSDLRGDRCLPASTGSPFSSHGLRAGQCVVLLLGQDDPDMLAVPLNYLPQRTFGKS